jgi:PAS domain S-box-containing protein
MALLFVIGDTIKQFWILPVGALPPAAVWATFWATIFNIGIGALIVQLIINLRDRLDQSLHDLRVVNEQVRAQASELSQQYEELEQQSVEMAEQNEELQTQSETIGTLNVELSRRGAILESLLDSARLQRAEETVLHDICVAAVGIFDDGASAAIHEIQGDMLVVLAGASFNGAPVNPAPRPVERTFTELVIRTERTAALNDVSLRPDLSILGFPGRPSFRAVLAAPFRVGGCVSGTVTIYSDQPREWTDEHFRVVEWMAAQSGHILETLRLQNDLRRQAALINLTPDGIIVRDYNGTITFWSEGARSLYGWGTEEALGHISHELLGARFSKPLDEINEELAQHGRWSGELTHTTKQGSEIVVESRWLARRGDDGRILEVLVSNVDITDRKRAEEGLRKANEELEQRVDERTGELREAYDRLKEETAEREQAEAQLRQAQKVEALGTLSGGIAHDFNNILAAIIGFTELAADHIQKGSREERHIARVLEAGIRGRELVQHLLTFSRKTEQEKKPLLLSAIVKDTVKLLRATTPTTVSIRVNTVSESGLILGDPTQIRQILMNLCTNAVYAMRESGGVLDIELSDFSVAPSHGNDRGMTPGLYMKLVVRDTGIGMEPDIIHRVFDPFFTTKKVGEGTGLGLSVVHGIVKQSNGHITAESEPGKGAAFTVCFPKIAEKRESEEPEDASVPTGHERILFVDDEEALVQMGQGILAGLGYEVTSRMSSKEALSLFQKDPSLFDLVITDQTMPEMTGVELAKRILAIRPDMSIILCTGFSHLVDADAANIAGIRAFAMKPLTKREIARIIRHVLDG